MVLWREKIILLVYVYWFRELDYYIFLFNFRSNKPPIDRDFGKLGEC